MHGYEYFSKDVSNYLGEFLQTNDFKIVQETSTNVIVENNFVGISFFLDHMNLDSFFYDIKTKERKFTWGILLQVLFPSYISEWLENQNCDNQSRECVVQRLINYNDVISGKFYGVVKGDFSWIYLYQEKEREGEILMDAISDMDNQHPIKKKYLMNDLSWINDLKILLKKKGDL